MRIYNFFVLALFFCVTSTFAQNTKKTYKVKTHQVDNFIKEVYQDKADAIIFSDAIRYKGFKDLLLKRIQILKKSYNKGEEIPNLSEVPLFKTYNKNLTGNNIFNMDNFNPLKYHINFFLNETVSYRINDQYILTITSQKTNQKH